jgi:hypothetical protein
VAQIVILTALILAIVITGTLLLVIMKLFHTQTSTGLDINVAGSGIVGAYGTGYLPLINTEGLIFNLSLYGIDNAKFVDWRIMDLEVDGGGLTTSSLARGRRSNRYRRLPFY